MKLSGDRRLRTLSFVYRALVICLAAICLVFIAGTVYGLFFHAAPGNPEPADTSPENGRSQTFTAIGRIRVPTKASSAEPQPGMVILFVSFIYYPADKAFSEELVLKVGRFREIISAYIASFSLGELQKKSEEEIKAELLRRFNGILQLGQIETLYFSDFMIVG